MSGWYEIRASRQITNQKQKEKEVARKNRGETKRQKGEPEKRHGSEPERE